MLKREEKEQIVAGIKSDLERSKAVFLTNLIGVSSNESTEIRKKLRDAEGGLKITRNTLLSKAVEGSELQAVIDEKKGPMALAFAFEDAPGVAKILYDAAKEYDSVEIFKGILDDKILDTKEIEALAKLPSRDQMLATLLATFNAPVSAFVRVLNAIKEKEETTVE